MGLRALLVAIALAVPQTGLAGSPSVVIAVGYSPHVPAVKLQLRADYVAVPIIIQSDSKDTLSRIDQIEQVRRAIADRIKSHPDLAVRFGVVSLSPRDAKSFISYESSGGSSAQLHVLAPLRPDATVFGLTKRMHQVITALPAPNGAKVVFGNTTLGMDDPERFRPQLLGLIAKATAEARKLLNTSGPADIEGLEHPVAVMQVNDSEVVLFINYRARIQLKGV